MMRRAFVETKNICKDFQVGEQKLRVLFDVSVKINAGELTMLVGPSGCGKTTLLSIVSGILSASSGEVIIKDTVLTKLSDRAKVEFRLKNLGFIFQQYNLLPALTVAENAAIPLIAAGMKSKEACEKAIAILREIGMENHVEKLPSQLSGGQQQRVAIARALVHRPSVIVCDEPTAALDAATGHKVMEILRDNALKSGSSVVVVTHDSRIYEFANRIIEMEDGRILNEK
jgi:putative ABC transport system ATP-binding protein